MTRKKAALICIALGVIAIVFGCFLVIRGSAEEIRFSANEYDLESAKFGGDFNTYIYGGVDMLVDTTNELNQAMENLIDAQNALNDSSYKSSGFIVMAIGLMIIAMGVRDLANVTDTGAAGASAGVYDQSASYASAQTYDQSASYAQAPAQAYDQSAAYAQASDQYTSGTGYFQQ